jgi:long-chain acyl-CoA synthetase
MDADGFFYFRLRAKRMLKVSGINVYPAHVEEILRKHPDVKDLCIIGIPDQHQITRIKAIVILKDNSRATEETKQSIMKFGLDKLLKYECPRNVDFITELPKTLVGKIHWKKLEDEELAKLKAAKKYPFDVQ